MKPHFTKPDTKISDWTAIVWTVVVSAGYGLAKRLIAVLACVGVVINLFPDLASTFNAVGWDWPGVLAAWAGQNFLPLSLLVLLYLAWSVRTYIAKIEETQRVHDMILAGVMNYIDAVPRPPEHEEHTRKGTRRFLADGARRFWEYWGDHAWIPFWGAQVRELYRYKIYNTVFVREGQRVTLAEDLHVQPGKARAPDA